MTLLPGPSAATARRSGFQRPPASEKPAVFQVWQGGEGRLVPVLEAKASPYDHSGPLQPLVDFRTYSGSHPRTIPKQGRSKIASRIEAAVPELIDDVAVLAEFLGIPDTRLPPSTLDPKVRHARLINLVSSLVRDGTRTPSVIIIEDIHWLDEASIEFVSALVRVAPISRALLVLTYRPTFQAPWKGGQGFHEIRLEELRDEDVSALTRDLIGDHPSTRAISDSIVERSGGNPFFAEELIRSLIDGGELDGPPGNYTAVEGPLAETLPATVQTVIGARIDRLPPADKEVLQIGATIGREFPVSVLAEVTRATAGELADILNRLSQVELVRGVTLEDEHDRFAFRHPLIQEVAYAMQLRTRRVELHSAVAKALERFHHNQLSEYADLIAYHFEAARDLSSAAIYTARSAAWIGTTNARLALKSWQKVHLLLQSQPRSPDTDRLRLKASHRS